MLDVNVSDFDVQCNDKVQLKLMYMGYGPTFNQSGNC